MYHHVLRAGSELSAVLTSHPYHITPCKPASGFLEEPVLCALLEIAFWSNAGNSLFSLAMPKSHWPGGQVSFIEKTLFLPKLINKATAGKLTFSPRPSAGVAHPWPKKTNA
jgi:hypothetical protein